MSARPPWRRGGVWTAERGGKRRPVVIVTAPVLCQVLSQLTVASVTTRVRGVSTEVALGTENGLVEGSVVNALDLVTVPVSRLTGYQGQLDRSQLERLDDALRLALGLDEL